MKLDHAYGWTPAAEARAVERHNKAIAKECKRLQVARAAAKLRKTRALAKRKAEAKRKRIEKKMLARADARAKVRACAELVKMVMLRNKFQAK